MKLRDVREGRRFTFPEGTEDAGIVFEVTHGTEPGKDRVTVRTDAVPNGSWVLSGDEDVVPKRLRRKAKYDVSFRGPASVDARWQEGRWVNGADRVPDEVLEVVHDELRHGMMTEGTVEDWNDRAWSWRVTGTSMSKTIDASTTPIGARVRIAATGETGVITRYTGSLPDVYVWVRMDGDGREVRVGRWDVELAKRLRKAMSRERFEEIEELMVDLDTTLRDLAVSGLVSAREVQEWEQLDRETRRRSKAQVREEDGEFVVYSSFGNRRIDGFATREEAQREADELTREEIARFDATRKSRVKVPPDMAAVGYRGARVERRSDGFYVVGGWGGSEGPYADRREAEDEAEALQAVEVDQWYEKSVCKDDEARRESARGYADGAAGRPYTPKGAYGDRLADVYSLAYHTAVEDKHRPEPVGDPYLAKRMSSNEAADAQYGVTWIVPGGKNGRKWFSTDAERSAFIDKLIEREGDDIEIRYSDPQKSATPDEALEMGREAGLDGEPSSANPFPEEEKAATPLQDAYVAGGAARLAGKTAHENPYSSGDEHEQWYRGWMEAKSLRKHWAEGHRVGLNELTLRQNAERRSGAAR